MNRPTKDVTVKPLYDDDREYFRFYFNDLITTQNFGRRLKRRRGLTPCQFICSAWATKPERFISRCRSDRSKNPGCPAIGAAPLNRPRLAQPAAAWAGGSWRCPAWRGRPAPPGGLPAQAQDVVAGDVLGLRRPRRM